MFNTFPSPSKYIYTPAVSESMRINPLGTRRYLKFQRHISGTQDSVVRITTILGAGQKTNPKQAPGECRRVSQILQTDLVATHLMLRLRMRGVILPLPIVRQRRNQEQLHLPDSSRVSADHNNVERKCVFSIQSTVLPRDKGIKAYRLRYG